MITYISGRGRIFMAEVLAAQSYAPDFNPDIGPTAFIFPAGATEREVAEAAKQYQDVIICCQDELPIKVSFPARFLRLSEIWPKNSTEEQSS